MCAQLTRDLFMIAKFLVIVWYGHLTIELFLLLWSNKISLVYVTLQKRLYVQCLVNATCTAL